MEDASQNRPAQSIRLIRVIGWLSVLAIVVLMGFAAMRIYPLSRYVYAARRINDRLAKLLDERPPDVPREQWEANVTWASIAFCNICFSESHTPYVQMMKFEQELTERLNRPAHLDLFPWIWDRLEETGPNGKSYAARYRQTWEEQSRSTAPIAIQLAPEG